MKTKKQHRKKRLFYSLFVVFLFLSLLWFSVVFIKQRGYGFSIQLTKSMPRGVYWIEPIDHINRGEIVVFYPSRTILQLMQKNHWINPKEGLMKYVDAVPGDDVCYKRHSLWINHQKIAYIYDEYLPGKKLPHSHFCGELPQNEYVLLSTRVKRSFDGRYFGPINRRAIIGRAIK